LDNLASSSVEFLSEFVFDVEVVLQDCLFSFFEGERLLFRPVEAELDDDDFFLWEFLRLALKLWRWLCPHF
jgi:hypothetical protein